MAFPFGRQTSRDALEETRRSIRSSLTERSSKIFGSVMGAKRGLIGGITSTFDQVVNIVGGGGGGGGGVDGGETAVAGAEDGSGGGGGAGPPKPRPPKPPAPRQRPGGAVVVDSNGTVSRQQAPGPSKGNPDKDGPASASGTDFADGKQRRKIDVKHPLKRRNTNPFMDDYDPSAVEPDYAPSDPPGVKDADDEVAHRDVIKVNVVAAAGAAAQKRHSEAWISRAGSGGQDLSSSLQQRRRASEAAAAYSGGMHVPDHSDADSEGTEGCDEEEEEEEEEEEKEKEDRLLREAGVGSDPIRSMQWGRRSSGGGGGGGDEVEADPVSEFMEYFVRKIFNRSQEITSTDKAKFGELCQNGFGRLWFAKCINSQCTNDRSSVSEETFYALVQFFVVVLFECNEAEDYEPAKTLMNTCFTFHCKAGVGSKQFLYSFVKDQPIWQSPRFWTAALFYAVQQERASTPLRNEKKEEEKQDNQEDITYEQLRSFAANMRALGLSKEQCLEFIRKQAATTNVSPGLQNQLRQGMERWTEDAAPLH